MFAVNNGAGKEYEKSCEEQKNRLHGTLAPSDHANRFLHTTAVQVAYANIATIPVASPIVSRYPHAAK